MTSRLQALCCEAEDPSRVAGFWAGLLGRELVEDAPGVLLPGDETQVGLRFVPGRPPRTGPERVHLHMTSSEAVDQQQQVATALQLGACHLDVGQRPEEGHVVLGDPEGNAFCVIEAGNVFLAGCGLLGELACEGTRGVGQFWSAALGWPLVWDQDEETAVQSPRGGTKVAWGGPPVAAPRGRERQWFELVPSEGDQQTEIDRLVGLGATRLKVAASGSVSLADPDGNAFTLRPG